MAGKKVAIRSLVHGWVKERLLKRAARKKISLTECISKILEKKVS
jgi:wobble nucleotide-excising tRNase